MATSNSSSFPSSLFREKECTYFKAFLTISGLAEYTGITGSSLNSCYERIKSNEYYKYMMMIMMMIRNNMSV